MDSFRVSIEELQPSQLFLSARKLREVRGWFDFDAPEYEPVSVLRLDGEFVIIDGHTRAYLAHLAGVAEVEVRDVTDREHPLALYADCVAWCEGKGLTTVADFAGRVVSHETYERRWIERCERVAEVLDK